MPSDVILRLQLRTPLLDTIFPNFPHSWTDKAEQSNGLR